ncbi:hypothetical protein LPJ53_000829 [Coemansia erecta]|uniref:Uncharacterized protein n=1 Tax=Coemansia erecta TaxID=147472 RepID=A0A9W8CST4_9FUNG|nr:hypothetical protein LPJ53_000829 [Coemansia erecta]
MEDCFCWVTTYNGKSYRYPFYGFPFDNQYAVDEFSIRYSLYDDDDDDELSVNEHSDDELPEEACHSIILGTDVCTDKRVNYYSYLDNYLGFAALALNRPINIYLDDKKTTTDNTTLNTGMMDPGTPVNITGKMSAGGDWYARQLAKD